MFEALEGFVKDAPLPCSISWEDLEEEFSRDPMWPRYRNDFQALRFFAGALRDRRMRELGQVPPGYSAARTCKHCGPVLVEPWRPEAMIACPWCLNRLKGQPIPSPGGNHQ